MWTEITQFIKEYRGTLLALIIAGVVITIICIFVNHDTLGKIGPFISGTSLFFAAAVAWITAYAVTGRNAEIERANRETNAQTDRANREANIQIERANREANIQIERNARSIEIFRNLYAEFWGGSDAIGIVRRWIVSDCEYEAVLRDILIERNTDKNVNNLPAEENKRLDHVDQFCSILTRIVSFQISQDIAPPQIQVLNHSINPTFWLRIIADKRPELDKYLDDHWLYLKDIAKSIPPLPA